MTLGSMFKPLGSKLRRPSAIGSKPRGVKTNIPKSMNYQRIENEVEAAISLLSRDQQAQIPIAGTLPERMVALALLQLGYFFQCQRPEDGGRLRIGGAVVDFIVYVGGRQTLIRVQGDYWHSLPERRRSDLVQAERLRAKGYRVFDAWEHAIYEAWTNGRLADYVEQGVMNAA